MAKIGLNIVVSGFTGKLLIRWLENSAPLSEVGRSDPFDFPYNDVYTITGLNPVAHLVQLWQSVDGVALTQLITEWQIDATLYNEVSSNTYQYQVDRGWDNTAPLATGPEVWADPVNLDTELTDERLDGATQDELLVHEAGYGNKINSEYELKPGGGIILLGGKTFDNSVAWFITYTRIITQQETETVSSSGEITDVQVITANTNFYTDVSTNLYNKLVIANGSGPSLVVAFQALSLIPNNTKVHFQTHRGAQNYLALQFNVGDTVYFNGQQVNVIHLAKGEEIKLWFKDGVCYVVSYQGNAKIRGLIIGDSQDRSTTNGAFMLADESVGVLDAADWIGLYTWLKTLPPGVTVSMTAWATDKTKWALDEIAETFRPPHLENMHRRFRDGAEAPGTYLADGVGPHYHEAGTETTNTPAFRRSNLNHTRKNWNVGNTDNSDKSSTDINKIGATEDYATETTVKAYKEIPMIYL